MSAPPRHEGAANIVQSQVPPLILIADDDADMRRALRGVLSPHAKVVEAPDGAAALRLLGECRPRLVLLDVVMPEMNGIEALQAIRERSPELPVLMLTGEADIAMAKLALDSGARAYITKPFEPEKLLEEVLRLIAPAPAETPEKPWRVRP